MRPTLRIALTMICLLFVIITNGQTCVGGSFTPPTTPSNCAYTYTNTGLTGWQDGTGADTTPPPTTGGGNILTDICILADLTYNFGSFKDNTFYVAPGVTFTGDADSIKCTLIIEGTAVFASTPGTGGTNIYIYPSGSITLPESISVSSGDAFHNAGNFNIGVVNTSPIPNIIADLAVSSTFWSYLDSKTVVTGNTSISGTYNNCGLLEVYGDIAAQGVSQFNNQCASYIHGNFTTSGEYTNVGLMYFEGNVDMTGPGIFYNEGTLIFYDLILTNDEIIGIGEEAFIIARNTATLNSGANVTNTYFYNSSASPPAGGGFNTVCGSCTADIRIVSSMVIPSTPEEILINCGAALSASECNPTFSGNLDTDFDGISNICDLDDDNDGILDSDECSDLAKTPLLNSNFEDLDITNGLDGGATDVVGTTGIWKGDASNIPNWESSDATNNHLEIWHNTQGAGSDAGGIAFSGKQWAEVNATTNDGLYQDITTTPGDVLNWSFAHRKRTSYAGSAQEDIVRLLIGNASGTLTSQGDFSSAGDASWTEHSGTYTVPAGQTVTRLKFTAIAVASGGGTTSGNFVDKVRLTVLPNCEDTDVDGLPDHIDIDSDDDGIPDNVEAQPTIGYLLPSGMSLGITDIDENGIDDNYGLGFLTLEDSDFDGLPDFRDSNSDNDALLDIEENGMANAVSGTDTDGDGLDDIFETTNNNDIDLDVNEDIEDPTDLSILPDADGDLALGGDLDYRDYFNTNPPSSATIDFDGDDDYLSGSALLQGLGEVTIMAWIKLTNKAGVTDRTIAGEDVSCRIYRKHGNIPSFGIRLSSGVTNVLSGSSLADDEWHHIAGIFNSTTGTQTLYIDGTEVSSVTNGSWVGETIEADSGLWNGDFEVGHLSRATSDIQYFSGNIDEVRVFNTALTQDQVQQLIYQEIENNLGKVRGTIIPKDVKDLTTSTTINWSSLIAYYPMTDIVNSYTTDYSGNNKTLQLQNINTVQVQTAPMPYETISDGSWTTESTWLHGDVWDIENTGSNKDWSIVKIANDVTASHGIKNIGLIIDSGKSLTVQGDNQVENSWYLELNGTLDLEDDSQLIQTINSDLVTSAAGKILRRQEGTPNAYRYNYWASPVGAKGVTSLTDNNAATNNANNSTFSLNMLKDSPTSPCTFTSAYTASGNISTYWLYTFINGLTYWDWAQISTSTALNPGVGYTQKGTGVGGTEQQYIFEGKPNNGTILVNVTDTGGPGSVANVSKTEYLLGNPYPSALDIEKFILDNSSVINGYIQLWEQWSGNSHNLSEYNGGYALVNLSGSVQAYQFSGFYGGNNGSQDGTNLPTRYLPIGQGFITEIVADGNIEFNNSQRIFKKEADYDGAVFENGSVFSKSGKGKSSKNNASKETETNSVMQKIRIEFNSITGPGASRELLMGFSDFTTDGYDYGYDAINVDITTNDLNLNLDGVDYNIQAYGPITNDKVVAFNFKSSASNTFNIKVTELVELDETQAIYLRDNLTGTYYDLHNHKGYSFTSEQGVFNDRFEIVFQSEQQSLSTEETLATDNFMYYQHNTNTFYAKKLNTEVKNLAVINMRGQHVMELQNVSKTSLKNGIRFDTMATGTYVVCLKTETNQVITKKIVIN